MSFLQRCSESQPPVSCRPHIVDILILAYPWVGLRNSFTLCDDVCGSTNGTTTTYSLTDAQGSLLTSLSATALTGEQLYAPYGPRRYTVGTPGTAKAFTGLVLLPQARMDNCLIHHGLRTGNNSL